MSKITEINTWHRRCEEKLVKTLQDFFVYLNINDLTEKLVNFHCCFFAKSSLWSAQSRLREKISSEWRGKPATIFGRKTVWYRCLQRKSSQILPKSVTFEEYFEWNVHKVTLLSWHAPPVLNGFLTRKHPTGEFFTCPTRWAPDVNHFLLPLFVHTIAKETDYNSKFVT